MTGQLSFDDIAFNIAGAVEDLAMDGLDAGGPAVDETTPAETRSVERPPHSDSTPALTVDLIRSAKRKKTSQARLRGDVLEVRIPAWISDEQAKETVDHFVEKFERSRLAQRIDPAVRAGRLAADLDLPEPRSIAWVSNQRDRWGSCTPSHGTIRLSDRMAEFPSWVIDYVIVHELAHLLEPNHGPEFWAIVNRYALAERARGYLIAKGHEGA